MLEEMPFDHKKNRLSQKGEVGDKKRAATNLVNSQVNLFECEQLSEKAVELIFNNKINAKNAFDVNVEYLEKLPHLLKRNQETSWHKASASLDASAKIYGYRVDSVHSETYKILGGLTRADNKDNEEENAGEVGKKEKKERRHDGFSTLEKDLKKLDLVNYELEFEVDPLFKSMTAKFAESGARGLLLNSLPLDCNMDVLLESKSNQIEEEEIKNDTSRRLYEIPSEVKSVIENATSQFSISDIKSIQICPDLSYFKKSRELETSLERTFYNNLMQEFDSESMLIDGMNNRSQLDDSLNIGDNIDDDNDNFDNLSYHSHHSNTSLDSAASPENLDMNLNMLGIGKANEKMLTGISCIEGFSYLKSDDIKEYIQNFGDGNREVFKNLPHYKNFTKSFNQLEKLNNNLNIAKEAGVNKRGKKEEVLFNFSVEDEIGKCEIFEKESKVKKNVKDTTGANKREKMKKSVRQFYFYDKFMLHNLFSIQDRHIRGFAANDEDVEGQANSFEGGDDFSNDGGDIDADVEMHTENNNIMNNPVSLDPRNANPETFAKINNEYEKKFGRLYKTFDVRVIKSKIWESISDFNSGNNLNKNTGNNINFASNPTNLTDVDFRKIVDSVSTNLNRDVLNNISTSTCFVCLLHLSNEKNLVLEQVDENNFTIKTEFRNQEALGDEMN